MDGLFFVGLRCCWAVLSTYSAVLWAPQQTEKKKKEKNESRPSRTANTRPATTDRSIAVPTPTRARYFGELYQSLTLAPYALVCDCMTIAHVPCCRRRRRTEPPIGRALSGRLTTTTAPAVHRSRRSRRRRTLHFCAYIVFVWPRLKLTHSICV